MRKFVAGADLLGVLLPPPIGPFISKDAAGPIYACDDSKTVFEAAHTWGMIVPKSRDALYECREDYSIKRIIKRCRLPFHREGGTSL